METFRHLPPVLQRNLLVLFATGLLFWASLASLLPILPLYIKQLGGSNHEVGIVMGAFAIGLLLCRPQLGQLADRRGRKLVLLIGLVVATIAPLGYLVSHTIPTLIVVRIVHGVSIAAFATAYSALIVDLAPVQHRGELIGYMSLVNPIGVALGPAIGGYLQSSLGYSPLFWMAATLAIVGLVCCQSQVHVPAQTSASEPSQTGDRQVFWQLLLSPRIRIPTLTMLLVGIAFGTLSTFVPLFMKEAGVTLNPGLFYTSAAIASFAVRLLAGRASDRYGRGRLLTLGLVLYTLAMFTLWSAHSAPAFLAAGLLEGAGAGTFLPMMIALVGDRSLPLERGRVFSLCMGGFDLGLGVAGPSLGFIADWAGYRGLFGLATGLVLLGLLSFVTLSSKDLAHSLRFSLGKGRDLYAISLNPNL